MQEFEAQDQDDFDSRIFPILAVLQPDELHFIRSIAMPLELAANVPVISEGRPSEYLYLVKSGLLRVNKRHGNEIFEVGSITPGEVFGEASILFNAPAGAEVRTVEPTEVYQIPAEHVKDILAGNERFARSITQLAENRTAASALAVNPIFSKLPQAVREVVLYNSHFVSLNSGDMLIQEGDADTRYMFIVLGGDAEVSMQHPREKKKRIVFARLSSGDEVGEIAVITGKPHAASVKATSPLRLLMISNDMVQSWRKRYSDFGYALYACVQHKLQHSLEALRNIMDSDEAQAMTTGTLPPMKDE
jgi:CRP-like cAMP-binding protein